MSGDVYFVTGTDTDAGKTVATAWLGWALQNAGRRVALVKPFQTGALDPATEGDEALYRQALGAEASVRTLQTLPEPLAPSIAAERAGVTLSAEDAVRECRAIGDAHDLTLVEGAGGLLVSITAEADMAGVAAALAAPLVVVVRPALGTLNHTLLTLEAAERRGLEVALIVVSGYRSSAEGPPSVVEAENLRYFRERLPQIPLLVLGLQDPTAPDFPRGIAAHRIGPLAPLVAALDLPTMDVATEVAQARW
ncbi:MAG: 8-amino-7-oxononanoate synthase/dethiobiotin synthetase [Chloroflexi bacterium]|nr:MAG: 8-amino-7-oxononanoate synthase/dethiobiotin synthetase [Chloroflexota bacterium]